MAEIRENLRLTGFTLEELNRVLGRIQDRLDELEGRRGTPTFYSAIDMQANKIIDTTIGSSSGEVITYDALADLFPFIDHGVFTGLTDDDHTQYAKLAGRSTNQTLQGAVTASGTLTLQSTAHATKGNVLVGGDASHYSYFENDGTLVFNGNATVWEDLRVPGLAVKTGATAPGFGAFVGGGLLAYTFDGSTTAEQVYFCIQVPHSYKHGTAVKPHVHWTPTTADAGNVVWQLEYTWANIDGTFGSSSTIETTAVAAGGTAWVHKMSSFSDISGSGKTISSMLVCRLFRDPAHSGDTYEADVSFLEFDLHFESDTVGSRSATSK